MSAATLGRRRLPAAPSAANGTRARARTSRRSHRLVRMRRPNRPPPSSASRGAMASATVLTRLAPMASRQSTCTWTTTRRLFQRARRPGRRRPPPMRTSRLRGPPPRATSRGTAAQASARISRSCSRSSAALALRVADPDQLHLGGHHRIVGLGLEAAPGAHHPRGVGGGGDHRGLLDRHGHQVVPAVDPEVEPQAQRQRVDPHGVLDQSSASPASRPPLSRIAMSSGDQRQPGPAARRAARAAAGDRSRDPRVDLGHAMAKLQSFLNDSMPLGRRR